MKLGFGQIEGALRELEGVHPDKAASFRARLRYLQQRVDLGIPRGGVGRRANFTVGHALLFYLGVEMQQFGMAPAHIAEMVSEDREELVTAVRRACGAKPDDDAILLFFYPQALADLQEPNGKAGLPLLALKQGTAKEFADFLGSEGLVRLAFLNLTAVVDFLIEELAGEGGDRQQYVDELLKWADEEGAE